MQNSYVEEGRQAYAAAAQRRQDAAAADIAAHIHYALGGFSATGDIAPATGAAQQEATVRLEGSLWLGLNSVVSYMHDGGDRPGKGFEKRKSIKQQAMFDLRISADSGSATAQHVMGLLLDYSTWVSGDEAGFLDTARWMRKAAAQGVSEASYELGEIKGHLIMIAQIFGSATIQHTVGFILYYSACASGAKADFLDAARWIRKAAMQGDMEAQYELGEMFRHGLFCDIYMRFARKYIRRASRQGYVAAVRSMEQLRSCVLCGADDAPLACSRCHQARYCDSVCSIKHWCEGDGVGGGVSGGAAARHKDICPRTHKRTHKRRSKDEGRFVMI
jgi:TPR repeat protein